MPRLTEAGVKTDRARSCSISGKEIYLGADPRCQMAIEDDPFVNGKHARIYQDETGRWMIEDKKSLNGVWIRVKKFAMDRQTEFQLGQQRFRFRPNVSTHHARLTVNGGEVVLEDLGSTNCTSVGAVENKVSRAVVQVGDTIFLGSTAYQVSDLIARAQPTHNNAVDRRVSQKNSSQSRTKNPLQWVAIGGGVMLLLLLGGFVMRHRDRGEPSPVEISVSSLPPAPAEQKAAIDSAKNNIAGPPKLDALEVAVPAPTTEETIASSLYVFVRTDAEQKKLELDHVGQIARMKYLNEYKWQNSRFWDRLKNHPVLSESRIRNGDALNFLLARLAASSLPYQFDPRTSRYGAAALQQLDLNSGLGSTTDSRTSIREIVFCRNWIAKSCSSRKAATFVLSVDIADMTRTMMAIT